MTPLTFLEAFMPLKTHQYISLFLRIVMLQ